MRFSEALQFGRNFDLSSHFASTSVVVLQVKSPRVGNLPGGPSGEWNKASDGNNNDERGAVLLHDVLGGLEASRDADERRVEISRCWPVIANFTASFVFLVLSFLMSSASVCAPVHGSRLLYSRLRSTDPAVKQPRPFLLLRRLAEEYTSVRKY